MVIVRGNVQLYERFQAVVDKYKGNFLPSEVNFSFGVLEDLRSLFRRICLIIMLVLKPGLNN